MPEEHPKVSEDGAMSREQSYLLNVITARRYKSSMGLRLCLDLCSHLLFCSLQRLPNLVV